VNENYGYVDTDVRVHEGTGYFRGIVIRQIGNGRFLPTVLSGVFACGGIYFTFPAVCERGPAAVVRLGAVTWTRGFGDARRQFWAKHTSNTALPATGSRSGPSTIHLKHVSIGRPYGWLRTRMGSLLKNLSSQSDAPPVGSSKTQKKDESSGISMFRLGQPNRPPNGL
jgi:hypothetical protein